MHYIIFAFIIIAQIVMDIRMHIVPCRKCLNLQIKITFARKGDKPCQLLAITIPRLFLTLGNSGDGILIKGFWLGPTFPWTEHSFCDGFHFRHECVVSQGSAGVLIALNFLCSRSLSLFRNSRQRGTKASSLSASTIPSGFPVT